MSESVRVTGVAAVQANIAKLRKIAPQFVRDAVNGTALSIQSRAKVNITDQKAVDTGRLRSAIKIEQFSNGMAARIGADIKYAAPVEFGSRPHFPPLAPIREWCRRHSIPESMAYPIALKISKTGSPARPFLYPALESERGTFERMIRTEWQKLSGQLS